MFATSGDSLATSLAYALGGLLLAAIVVLIAWLRLHGAEFGVHAGELSLRTSSRRKLIARDPSAAQAIRVYRAEDLSQVVQIWSGPEGVIALHETIWDRDQLQMLARSAGIDVVDLDEPLTVRQIARTYPGSLPCYAAHPLPAAVLLAVSTIAVVGLLDQLG